MDLKILAEQLVKKCQKMGADSAEVYIESGRQLGIQVRNGEIETVEEAAAQGAGLRVFYKQRMAFSSCNDLSETALDNAVTRAIEFAKVTTPDENNVLPDDLSAQAIPGLYDAQIKAIPMDKKIALAKEVEKLAMQDRRISKSAGARYNEGESQTVIANSTGLCKSQSISSCGYGVYVVAEKGEQKATGGESCYRHSYADLKGPAEIAAKAAREAYSMLDARLVKTQKCAVIFDPDAAYALLGGIVAALNGESVLQGASFLAQKRMQKIASALITIIDDGTLPKGLASANFDGEGVTTQKRTLVDRGVLQGFIYNTAVARRAGVKSTGNASRGGFTSLPDIGTHNVYIAAGTASPADIIADTKTGLLLKEVTGYGINPVNGNFSGGAAGFWIENGKIAYPVQGLTIAATADDMLNGIDMLGNDLDLFRSMTAPTLRVRSMQVGGE